MWEIELRQLFILGGPLMWPLLLCSIVAMAIVIERLYYFVQIREDETALKNQIIRALGKNDLREAMAVCDRADKPVARVLKAGLLRYGRSRDEIEAGMNESARAEILGLEQRVPLLLIISRVAPLLGILGTVTGLCSLFHLETVRFFALNPMAPASVASAVWQALISTEGGLIVSISCTLAAGFLGDILNDRVRRMERVAVELADFLTLSREAD